jgi:hypothetical protein
MQQLQLLKGHLLTQVAFFNVTQTLHRMIFRLMLHKSYT